MVFKPDGEVLTRVCKGGISVHQLVICLRVKDFNGSVSDNIGLGEKQLVGNERYVSHIFCGLGLDHVLGKMPNCLEMDLGQFYFKISAGQQQRVAWDEALNAIDEDTEKSVFNF